MGETLSGGLYTGHSVMTGWLSEQKDRDSTGYSMAGLNGTAFCSSSLQEMDEEVEGDTLHLQPGMEEVRAEILGLSGFSGRLERVLLALLRKQATDRERMESNHTQLLANLEKERGEREKDKELVDRKLQELEKERKARKDIGDTLREQLEGIGKDLKADIEEMGRGVGVIEEKMKEQVGACRTVFVTWKIPVR